jgi:hypothetical protein
MTTDPPYAADVGKVLQNGPHAACARRRTGAIGPPGRARGARFPLMDRIAYFARVVDESPGVARARFAYAVELQRAARFADAADQYRAYLAMQEDEGNAWGRLAECLVALDARDDAADAYLAGIDQALKFGHHGMADEFRDALDAL